MVKKSWESPLGERVSGVLTKKPRRGGTRQGVSESLPGGSSYLPGRGKGGGFRASDPRPLPVGFHARGEEKRPQKIVVIYLDLEAKKEDRGSRGLDSALNPPPEERDCFPFGPIRMVKNFSAAQRPNPVPPSKTENLGLTR